MRARALSDASTPSRARARSFARARRVFARTTRGRARENDDDVSDVVVIGAGIGGLSAAAIIAKCGMSVTVLESHNVPGGAAHAWARDGYTF